MSLYQHVYIYGQNTACVIIQELESYYCSLIRNISSRSADTNNVDVMMFVNAINGSYYEGLVRVQ